MLDGHMDMSKCVLTLQQELYCPNLAYHVIRMYIISCHCMPNIQESQKNLIGPTMEELLT